jgi:Zn-dependent protease with chaperone function
VTWSAVIVLPTLMALASWVIATLTLRLATPRPRTPPAAEPFAASKTPFRDPYTDTSVHWMERARIAYGPRWLASLNVFLLPLLCGIFAGVFGGELAPGGRLGHGLLCAAAAFVGPFLVRVRHENRLRRVDWTYAFWLRSHGLSMLLLASHVMLVAVVGLTMPATFTARGLATAALALPLLVALGLGGGVVVLRALGLLKAAPERLQRLVAVAATRTGRTPREVLVAPLAVVNVFSYPAVGRVLMTEVTFDALDDDALTAMLGHALAHLTESTRRSLLRALAASVIFVPLMLARPLTHEGFGVFSASLGAVFVVVLLINRWLRYDFKAADKVAREHEGDAGTYARALVKVYEANVVPAVLNQKNPARAHLYDRMIDAGMTPDHPRPATPPMGRAVLALLVSIVATMMAVAFALATLSTARPESALGRYAIVAITGGRGQVLGDLAFDAWQRHDLAGSVALYRAAVESERRDVYLPANLAIVLADAGRCVEASEAFNEAAERLARRSGTDGERAIAYSASVAEGRCYAEKASR